MMKTITQNCLSAFAGRRFRRSHEFYSAQVKDAERRLVAIFTFASQKYDSHILQVEYWKEAAQTLAAIEVLYPAGTADILKLRMRQAAELIDQQLSILGEYKLQRDFVKDFFHLLIPAVEELR